jgi:hypothetical protein
MQMGLANHGVHTLALSIDGRGVCNDAIEELLLSSGVRVSRRRTFGHARSFGVWLDGWIGHKPGSGLSDMPRPTLGVFASLDRF